MVYVTHDGYNRWPLNVLVFIAGNIIAYQASSRESG